MSADINLSIRKKQEKGFITSSQVHKLRLVALIFLFGVAALSAGLFLIIAASPLPQLREEEQRASETLKSQQSKFGKYLLLREQLSAIQVLLNTRPDLRKTIEVVFAIIPQGLQVSGIEISEKHISMGVSTASLDAISSFFQSIQDRAVQKVVPTSISTSSIGYSASTGEYSFTITFD